MLLCRDFRVAVDNFEEAGSFEGWTVDEGCSWSGLAGEAFATEEYVNLGGVLQEGCLLHVGEIWNGNCFLGGIQGAAFVTEDGNCIGTAARDGFELKVWYVVEHDVDDGFGDVPSCFGVGILGKRGYFGEAFGS